MRYLDHVFDALSRSCGAAPGRVWNREWSSNASSRNRMDHAGDRPHRPRRGCGRRRAVGAGPGTIQEWRRYARDVEQGIRTPSGATTRLLTETAIAQQAHARSAIDLLRLMGAGVALLGICLAVDLIRYRARHTDGSATTES